MIGVDIVDMKRFIAILKSKHGSRFLNNIFSIREINASERYSKVQRIYSLASHYAIKEAIIKAAKGRIKLSDMKSIEVLSNEIGAPYIHVNNSNFLEYRYEVSCSSDGDYAVGIAIIFELKSYFNA